MSFKCKLNMKELQLKQSKQLKSLYLKFHLSISHFLQKMKIFITLEVLKILGIYSFSFCLFLLCLKDGQKEECFEIHYNYTLINTPASFLKKFFFMLMLISNKYMYFLTEGFCSLLLIQHLRNQCVFLVANTILRYHVSKLTLPNKSH